MFWYPSSPTLEPPNRDASFSITTLLPENFNLLSLTSQIHNLETKHDSLSQIFRLMSPPLITLLELELELIFQHFRSIHDKIYIGDY
ncbi:hypothetical protein AHAS_Ahas13G0250600 [Arachis hypogaea]